MHLGFRGCSAEHLLDFLRSTECEYLYLVGDIIDIWSMKKRPFWPQAHNDVVRTILGKAKHGTKVVFVPGNHDELLRDYDGMVWCSSAASLSRRRQRSLAGILPTEVRLGRMARDRGRDPPRARHPG